MRLTDPRFVSVIIPDDDRCEGTIRHAAEKMCSGVRVLVLEIPTIIPDGVMPQLIDKLNEVCRDAAGQVRHHLETTLVSAQLGTGGEHAD